MPAITEKKLQKSAVELERLIREAKKKPFEFETLANAREIKKGNFLEFKSTKDLFKNAIGSEIKS